VIAAVVVGVGLVGLMIAREIRSRRVNSWAVFHTPIVPRQIVCFGDSLVAGVGADSTDGTYPVQLARLLDCQVTAKGFSGATAADGWEHLQQDSSIRGDLVIVTLGGNDILRQIPLATTEANLSRIFLELHRRDTAVAFTGVDGLISGTRAARYRELCREHRVILVPDVLDGILADESLKSDQIHPNSAGYALMAQRVARALEPFLAPASDR